MTVETKIDRINQIGNSAPGSVFTRPIDQANIDRQIAEALGTSGFIREAQITSYSAGTQEKLGLLNNMQAAIEGLAAPARLAQKFDAEFGSPVKNALGKVAVLGTKAIQI